MIMMIILFFFVNQESNEHRNLTATLNGSTVNTLAENIQSRSLTAELAGGVVGAAVFLVLGVLIFCFVRKKIEKIRRNQSIKVNLFLSSSSTKKNFFLVNHSSLLLHGY